MLLSCLLSNACPSKEGGGGSSNDDGNLGVDLRGTALPLSEPVSTTYHSKNAKAGLFES
jgi:hypothetical protein